MPARLGPGPRAADAASIAGLLQRLAAPGANARLEAAWTRLSDEYEQAALAMPRPFMQRRELSFHPYVKLLGLLCPLVADLPGDILEIGVWKGKSLAFVARHASAPTKIIGIDPCALEGQAEELDYFQQRLFPHGHVVREPSNRALPAVLDLTTALKLLHIDGGHTRLDVLMDFLTFERFVVPGGFIVFDDYADIRNSPEVREGVDQLHGLGLFDEYLVVGPVERFENSFVLRKRPA